MIDAAQRLLDGLDHIGTASGKLVRMIVEAFGLDRVRETPHNDIYAGGDLPPVVLAKGSHLHESTLRGLTEVLSAADIAVPEEKLAELLKELEREAEENRG
ncbi:MAG: hypothetical protein ACRDJU_06995 [Actinomycetota bacterium]